MEAEAESIVIVSFKFPDNQTAREVKNKLKRRGIHAYLSTDETFDKFSGIEAWIDAHTVLNVVDRFPERGDLGDTYALIKVTL